MFTVVQFSLAWTVHWCLQPLKEIAKNEELTQQMALGSYPVGGRGCLPLPGSLVNKISSQQIVPERQRLFNSSQRFPFRFLLFTFSNETVVCSTKASLLFGYLSLDLCVLGLEASTRRHLPLLPTQRRGPPIAPS